MSLLYTFVKLLYLTLGKAIKMCNGSMIYWLTHNLSFTNYDTLCINVNKKIGNQIQIGL